MVLKKNLIMIFPKNLVIVFKCCNEIKIKILFFSNPLRFIVYGILSYVKGMEFQIKGEGCFLVQLTMHLPNIIWVFTIIL